MGESGWIVVRIGPPYQRPGPSSLSTLCDVLTKLTVVVTRESG